MESVTFIIIPRLLTYQGIPLKLALCVCRSSSDTYPGQDHFIWKSTIQLYLAWSLHVANFDFDRSCLMFKICIYVGISNIRQRNYVSLNVWKYNGNVNLHAWVDLYEISVLQMTWIHSNYREHTTAICYLNVTNWISYVTKLI